MVSIQTSKTDGATAKVGANSNGISSEPQIIRDAAALRQVILAARHAGQTIGLVPTMGALHEGHLSLIDAARKECDLAIATIYVNPTQFAPTEDYRRYPRDLDGDVSLLASRGCDVVFTPSDGEMYPPGHSTYVDVGPLGGVLEGEFRPMHFRGVATIVMKLFQMAPVDRAYFGRKDYQQTLVIKKMVTDLNVPIDVRVCPIVRESDGLAMSSRNAYLSTDERRQALVLSQSLAMAERMVGNGERSVDRIRAAMATEIEASRGVELQYIVFLRDDTVTRVETITGPTTIALAATVGKTRLIDNTLVSSD